MSNESHGELIVYHTEDGRVEVRLQALDGSVWLTQIQMADLFDTTKQNISLHIKNILKEGELPEATIKEFLTVQSEGRRRVQRKTNLYNLHMILAVGYRVGSPRGTQFRQWATAHLAEYLVKGFVMDDERLKNPGGWDYFDKLLALVSVHSSDISIRHSRESGNPCMDDQYETTDSLYSRQQTKRHPIYWRHQRLDQTGMGAQERFGGRVHEEIPRPPVGLLRTTPGRAGRDHAGKAAQEVESSLENRADRKAQPGLERLMGRHFWLGDDSWCFRPLSCHSRESGSPEAIAYPWVPACAHYCPGYSLYRHTREGGYPEIKAPCGLQPRSTMDPRLRGGDENDKSLQSNACLPALSHLGCRIMANIYPGQQCACAGMTMEGGR